ncbi:hypothetical protein DCAR_0933794 [Daucus carota subsp. sativus]|uniref:Photosystem I P700 chlorophyll a apoprotein A2 n=1 Tax=Daucus carota subsp. sativus TaxID=79200 RepID=A0A175YE25_DAUCS|nr:hypothetical protein DCAR_0933794 [Daucus carota subsp. sativus]
MRPRPSPALHHYWRLVRSSVMGRNRGMGLLGANASVGISRSIGTQSGRSTGGSYNRGRGSWRSCRGGLDRVTRGLWLTDIAHHHLAIAILFLIAGHMYKTNWGIGHGLKDILEAHKGPFTGQGHNGLYEILITSWHAHQ